MPKAPERSCVFCGEKLPKNELLRVVRTGSGQYAVDRTKKADGRGAYLCRKESCLCGAKKRRSFDRAFRGKVPEALYEEIEKELSYGERSGAADDRPCE